MTSTPQTTLKRNNKVGILNEILYNGAISKSELAQRLNSSKTTISKNANELIKNNLLMEIGKGSNTIGKKSTLLNINPDIFHFVVINLSGNQFQLNIYNLRDEVLYSSSLPTPNKNDIENILENCINKYSSFNLITTIILAIPGVVKELEIISNNQLYVDIYKKIYNFSINKNIKLLVHNDIDLQAEYLFANHLKPTINNFILIGASFGIGSSIFYNKKLLTGPNNFAGEIAFTNPKLVENKIENLESRCSIYGIQKKYYEKYNIHLEQKDLCEKIKLKDEFLNKLIDEIIQELSILIVNIYYILDIKNIYLSGYLFNLRDDMISLISKNVSNFTKEEAIVQYIPLHNKSINGSLLVVKREILKLI